MDLVFDIETDDLKATKIHCLVAQDIDSGTIYKYPPDKLQEGYELLSKADNLIGHNIIGFDIPMVEKFGEEYRDYMNGTGQFFPIFRRETREQ